MFRLFEKCRSHSVVKKTSQQEIDVQAIMDVYHMDKEVKRLIQNYPADDPLRQDYDKLPREKCSKDPVKFKQFKEGVEMVFQRLLERQKLDSFDLSSISM